MPVAKSELKDDKEVNLSVKVPQRLLELFDKAVATSGRYTNRSEALRDLMRKFIERYLGDDEIIDANNCDAEVLER
ncbi:hypothetical protein DRP04_05950 [Archaeoglobales archaeon]|nr:MAG: hypothetical protein DRP04_05950 [Archaeoglobales archaeon]